MMKCIECKYDIKPINSKIFELLNRIDHSTLSTEHVYSYIGIRSNFCKSHYIKYINHDNAYKKIDRVLKHLII